MEQPEINSSPQSPFRYFPFFSRRQAAFALAVIALLFYIVSIDNEYALDDGIVIHQNEYVLKGAAGIGDILDKDLYHSFYKRMNATDQLQGGRYHPVSVISFALEQQVLGAYRTGNYIWSVDLNGNGRLDPDPVSYLRPAGSGEVSKRDVNYEYNEFVDLNKDGQAQAEECYACWDTNKNFHDDAEEDLNQDGVFNEVDCQVRGAGLRHFNNIWLYVLAGLLLYLVLSRWLLPDQQDMAFLAALLFIIHPTHSEIVACVRGRGELFALIFMLLCFIFSFRFVNSRNNGHLLLASLMLWLALLSKEFAIMLLILVPLAFHVFAKLKIAHLKLLAITAVFLLHAVAVIFVKWRWPGCPSPVLIFPGCILFGGLALLLFRNSLREGGLPALMLGFYTFTLLYLGMRVNAVSLAPGVPDTELLNNPYLLAGGAERFATKVFVFLDYLRIGFFPAVLCSDYSYNTIPYVGLGSPDFIAALLINACLIVLGIVLCIRRHPMGFGIVTWYLFLILVGNFFFTVGATMRDAYLFYPTIGLAIVLAWLAIRGLDRLHALSLANRRLILLAVVGLVTVLCGYKAWERSRDWKNDVTLFFKDVKTNPNSVLILGNAGARWIDLADTREITGVLLPGEDSSRFNDYNGTLTISDEEVAAGGYGTKREAALHRGIDYLEKAVQLHPRYVNGYLNLGLAWYKLRNEFQTIYNWKMAERLYPNNPYLQTYYSVYSGQLRERGSAAFTEGRMEEAIRCYNLVRMMYPNDAENYYLLASPWFNLRNYKQARRAAEKALDLRPDYKEAKDILDLLNRTESTKPQR